LFLSAEGKRLEPDNFAKQLLKPIVGKLRQEGCCHGFGRGNATALDTLGASFMIRQARLGHVDPSTTLLYSHLVSEDDRRVSAQLGNLVTTRKKQGTSVILDPTNCDFGPNKEERQVVGLP
jgi:integrase